MGIFKTVASIGSSLLARKGQARPAMRQRNSVVLELSPGTACDDDLGWNDMGGDDDESIAPGIVSSGPESPAASETEEAGQMLEQGGQDGAWTAVQPWQAGVEPQPVLTDRVFPITELESSGNLPQPEFGIPELNSIYEADPSSPGLGADGGLIRPGALSSLVRRRPLAANPEGTGAHGQYSMTCRLDAELYNRLLAAMEDRKMTAQQVMLTALGSYLGHADDEDARIA